MSLTKICYNHITGPFYWSYYFNFKIIINSDTGFFNASKLCKDNGKRLKGWNVTEATNFLINEFRGVQWKVCEPSQQFTDEEWDDICKEKVASVDFSRGCENVASHFPWDIPSAPKKDSNPETHHGTYLHPKLLLPLVIWISPKMYIAAADIVEDFIVHAHERIAHDVDIMPPDISDDMCEKEYVNRVSQLDYKHYLELDAKERCLKKTVVKSPPRHCFRLIRKNWCEDEKHKVHSKFNYTTVCVQKRNLNKAMKRLHDKFPNFKIVLDLPYHPRARSMNKHIRKDLGGEFVKFRFNDLMSFVDEQPLVDSITVIYDKL